MRPFHAIVIFFMILLTSPSEAVVAAYGNNLVENPGAEDSTGSSSGENNVIPAWEDGQSLSDTAARSLDTAGNAQRYHPQYTVGAARPRTGMSDIGTNFFYGSNAQWGNDSVQPGQQPNSVAFQQTVNINALTGIAEGNKTFNASAWFGGYSNNNDTAYWDVTFLNGSGVPVGDAIRLGGVTAAERGNDSRIWLLRSATGLVPATATAARFDIWFTDPNLGPDLGSDGAIDNILFAITSPVPVPEPAAVSLLLGSLIFLRRPTKRR